jgi:hypothetical protein
MEEEANGSVGMRLLSEIDVHGAGLIIHFCSGWNTKTCVITVYWLAFTFSRQKQVTSNNPIAKINSL